MPTDGGYRFFVEHLMEREGPSAGEQRMIRHQFHQVEPDVDRWAHLASSVLANAVAMIVSTRSGPPCGGSPMMHVTSTSGRRSFMHSGSQAAMRSRSLSA